MLHVKPKQPSEILLEKKLRNPLSVSTRLDFNVKSEFFHHKMQDIIAYHLDYEKFNSKLISQEAFEELQALENQKEVKNRPKKALKDTELELKPEFLQIRELVQSKIVSLEKITSLVRSLSIVVEVTGSQMKSSNKTDTEHMFSTMFDILDKECNGFHLLLTLLDTYHQKQSSELLHQKKGLSDKHQAELLELTKKSENKIQALLQHNKILSSKKAENKLHQSLNSKIASLEDTIHQLKFEISEKNDQIKQKVSENTGLRQLVEKLNEEIKASKSEKKDLEFLVSVQQESYRSQIFDLTSEIARLKNAAQESIVAHEMQVTELKYVAESSKKRLEQAALELHQCEDELNYMKTHSKEKERALESEKSELQAEVERLDRIILSLKEDLHGSTKALEVKHLRDSQGREEEVTQLRRILDKMELESSQLLTSNKELTLMNQKLERDLYKLKDSKSLKSSKSEKKLKKK